MDLIAADIGNTMVDLGVFQGEKLVLTFRVPTGSCRTESAFFRIVSGRFGMRLAGFHSAYASVVPRAGAVFRSVLHRLTGRNPLAVGPASPLGFRVRYRPPSSLGADRLAAAAGALEIAGAPVIVVDFGTAITVDAVSRKRVFLGGAIAPGPALSAGALARGTARLPLARLYKPGSAIGRSTRECLASGIVIGSADLADGLVSRMEAEMGEKSVPVLATGGMAGLVAPYSRRMRWVVPGLVLEGVKVVAQRAGGKKR